VLDGIDEESRGRGQHSVKHERAIVVSMVVHCRQLFPQQHLVQFHFCVRNHHGFGALRLDAFKRRQEPSDRGETRGSVENIKARGGCVEICVCGIAAQMAIPPRQSALGMRGRRVGRVCAVDDGPIATNGDCESVEFREIVPARDVGQIVVGHAREWSVDGVR